MIRTGRVRLPLQVGTSALMLLAKALAMLVPSFVLVMLAPILALAIVGTRNVGLAQVFQYAFWIGGSVAIGRALRLLGAAYRRRPSDVLLDGESVRFDGGRHHGFELGWRDVQPATWSLAEVKGVHVLATGSGSETDLVLAETHAATERRSLGDLLTSIRAIARAKVGDEPAPPPPPPGVLLCARCGAPLAPEDGAAVACVYCHFATAVPDVLRARIRTGREEAARRTASAEAVTRLLDQRSAPSAARLLVSASVVMLGSWLVSFGAVFVNLWNGDLDVERSVVLLAFPLAVVLALFCAIRALLANRSALSLVAFHLGAGATARGTPACRRCAGPLGAPSGASPVVGCVYCGTENVLGLEIVRGRSVEEEHLTIEAALARRRADRAGAWALAGAAAVLGAVAAILLAGGA